jgi:hypothetical protein
MLLPFTPCGLPTMKQPYGHFRGGNPQGGWPATIFYPLGYPSLSASESRSKDGSWGKVFSPFLRRFYDFGLL